VVRLFRRRNKSRRTRWLVLWDGMEWIKLREHARFEIIAVFAGGDAVATIVSEKGRITTSAMANC